MTKILFICPRYSGGVGGHVSLLAAEMKSREFDVELFHVPHIPIKNFKNPSFILFSILKALCTFKKYDIIHAFNVPSGFAMRLIRARRKILSVHGLYSDQMGLIHSRFIYFVARFFEKLVVNWSDLLTTNSLATKIRYHNILGLKFFYLQSLINDKQLKRLPAVRRDQKQILYLGRQSPEKGYDTLKAAEKYIDGTVVYCMNSAWDKAINLLNSSSLLVVPSRMESQPKVIKEAFFS